MARRAQPNAHLGVAPAGGGGEYGGHTQNKIPPIAGGERGYSVVWDPAGYTVFGLVSVGHSVASTRVTVDCLDWGEGEHGSLMALRTLHKLPSASHQHL